MNLYATGLTVDGLIEALPAKFLARLRLRLNEIATGLHICAGTTTGGKPCTKVIPADAEFCDSHGRAGASGRCSGYNNRGKPCRAFAVKGTEFCYLHDGSPEAERAKRRVQQHVHNVHANARKCSGRNGRDEPCGRLVAPDDDLCFLHREPGAARAIMIRARSGRYDRAVAHEDRRLRRGRKITRRQVEPTKEPPSEPLPPSELERLRRAVGLIK